MIRSLVNVALVIAVMAVTNVSIAQVINVDIQGTLYGGTVQNYTGASANGPIASGTTWNHFNLGAASPNGQTLLNLVDDSGAATTVDVAFGTGWTGSYGDAAPNHLQGDKTLTSGGTGTFTISGLTPGGSYNIALITDGASFSSDYTIGGTTLTTTGGSAGTNVNGPLTFTHGVTHVLFSNITAAGGVIPFTVTAAPTWGILTGLQIEAQATASTPGTLIYGK
ncbi:MAG: hypothetical protein QGH15_04175 [Kiritimatiellia bacterium]|jgi:hypothetical protein|nr:hypothetical protein [Kiritimatiellia bacterium]